MDSYRSVVESERTSGTQQTLVRGLGVLAGLAVLGLLVAFWLPI